MRSRAMELRARLFPLGEGSADVLTSLLLQQRPSCCGLRPVEAGIACTYARVCTRTTSPYARHLEDRMLPYTERICASVRRLMR